MYDMQNCLLALMSHRIQTQLCLFVYCVQISLEPPQSLKSNLQQLLSSTETSVVSTETFERGDGVWRQLVFGLCMFHAVVNGRKKYGAVGWSTPYQFSSADLQVNTVRLTVSTCRCANAQ